MELSFTFLHSRPTAWTKILQEQTSAWESFSNFLECWRTNNWTINMEPDVFPFDLGQCVAVCDTLERLVSASFGPNGLHNLLCAATGKLMITSNGRATLQSLHMAHPCGQLLVKGSVSLHQVCGDCSKSYIFIIGAALRYINEQLGEDSQNRTSRIDPKSSRLELSHAFSHLKNCILPKFIVPCLLNLASVTLLSKDNTEKLCEVYYNIIWTTLQGQFNQETRQFLTNLLCRLIVQETQDISKLPSVLQGIIDDFSFIVVDSPGRAILNSSLLNGVVIQRDFMPLAAPSRPLHNVRFCLIGYPLETPIPSEMGEAVMEIRNEEKLRHSLSWKGRYLKTIFERLAHRQVQLILITDTVSELAAQMCRQLNISFVHAVPEEDIERLARMSSINVLHDPCDIYDDTSNIIGQCDVVRTINCGGHKYVYMEGVPSYKPNKDQTVSGKYQEMTTGTVLLCAPTLGICDHVASALLCSLKAVLMAFKPLQVIELDSLATHTTRASYPFACSTDKTKSSSTDCDQIDRTSTNIPCKTDISCRVQDSNSGLTTENPPGMKSSSTIDAALTVPGGGAFEICARQLLLLAALANRERAALAVACRTLAEAVLSVPLKLAQNSYAPTAKKLSTVQILQLINNTDNHVGNSPLIGDLGGSAPPSGGVSPLVGLDGRGGVGRLTDATIVEPLVSKVLMLYHVVELLSQLLRLDGVVPVQRIPNNDITESESDTGGGDKSNGIKYCSWFSCCSFVV